MVFHIAQVAMLIALEARKPKVSASEEVRWSSRAWPWYCDANLHVNNAQFTRIMEYGRWAWIVRTGVWARVRAERGTFLVAGSSQLFRREVRMFRGFEVRTRLSGIDERSAVFDQSVWTPDDGRLACHSYQRMIVVGGGRIRRPHSLLNEQVGDIDDPAIRGWMASQDSILAREKGGSLGERDRTAAASATDPHPECEA